jgi:hypothetical protein
MKALCDASEKDNRRRQCIFTFGEVVYAVELTTTCSKATIIESLGLEGLTENEISIFRNGECLDDLELALGAQEDDSLLEIRLTNCLQGGKGVRTAYHFGYVFVDVEPVYESRWLWGPAASDGQT